ncbi:MAG: hypothetical protein KIT35_15970 [Piscinibacter sp.]|uniref:hypothetical protein n=1 Tax=Piscinibacter TaxID=1114981 RepID=UPI000FDDBCDD|nr:MULTISPECIES: hypothetical protein [Piscinibacter]MCW5665329.1 hypothetical protein [Piscinibacter sp.]
MVKPWEQSAEFKQAKQTVDGVLKQIAEVKAHTARMTPRLGSFKKATLEHSLKEAKAGREQALRKNQELLASGPESVYRAGLEKEEKDALAKAKRDYEAAVKAISETLEAYGKAAFAWEVHYGAGDGVSGGSAGIYFRLLKAYEAQHEAIETELAVLAKEHGPNPKRTL